MITERECEFIGCGTTLRFIFEKIELAADRGYGVILEPVGSENDRVYNFYQVTPMLGRAAPALYEALKNLVNRIDEGLALGEKLDVTPARQAIAKVEKGD